MPFLDSSHISSYLLSSGLVLSIIQRQEHRVKNLVYGLGIRFCGKAITFNIMSARWILYSVFWGPWAIESLLLDIFALFSSCPSYLNRTQTWFSRSFLPSLLLSGHYLLCFYSYSNNILPYIGKPYNSDHIIDELNHELHSVLLISLNSALLSRSCPPSKRRSLDRWLRQTSLERPFARSPDKKNSKSVDCIVKTTTR